MRARQSHGRTVTPVCQRISQRRGVIAALCIAALGLLASCKSAAGGRGGDEVPGVVAAERVSVRVLEDTVRLVADGGVGFVATVEVRISNRSARPLYILNCGDPTQPLLIVQQFADPAWKATYRGVCPSVLGFPTVVAGHDSASVQLRLWHTTRPNTWPRFFADDPTGVTRVVVAAAGRDFDPKSMKMSDPVAADQGVSNAFVLTLVR